MAFFDPAVADDQHFLMKKFMTVLARATAFAAVAEADVLMHFTDAEGVVRLRGFAPVPAQCAPGLQLALKVTVAEVTNWRLGRHDGDPTVETVEAEKNKTVYRKDAVAPFPTGWDERLQRFALPGSETPIPDLWAF